jgi:2-polyprenyl-6-methoxyphenol hydroxylase-like FAD-dependent oxidoreductase
MAADANGTSTPVEEWNVLIVGGSLVGLTLSALLAQHGITRTLCVEKHTSTAIVPRATVMQPRSMQVFKELGLYEIMQTESLKYYDETACIVTIESLAGKLMNVWQSDVNAGIEDISATRRVFLTQQALEPLLRARARELGATLRFATEMVSFTQDDRGVTATLRNLEDQSVRQVRARYMVACDGFRSGIRKALDIPMHGPGLLSRALTIYFQIKEESKAALARLPNAHYTGVIYISNPTVRAFFRFDREKKESFLVINSAGEVGSEASRFPADTVTEEKAAEYLRAAIGDDSIEFDIHQLSTWEAVADMPERLRVGRVFLAGDAAHRMPPSGGFGGNSGIADAHNLAWKLALAVKGWSNDNLLETYEEERRPVAQVTVLNAFAHYVQRTEPTLSPMLKEFDVQEVPVEWLELAYRYHSRALFNPEPDVVVEDPKTAKARPGSVAHHVIVKPAGTDSNQPISDLFRTSPMLLYGPEGSGWRDGLVLSGCSGLFSWRCLDYAEDSEFSKRYDVSRSGAVLVRPDGFVAWSAKELPAASPCPSQLMADVAYRVMCFGG